MLDIFTAVAYTVIRDENLVGRVPAIKWKILNSGESLPYKWEILNSKGASAPFFAKENALYENL